MSRPLQPHHYRTLIRVCLALILLGSAGGIMLPAGLGWDFANFYDAGRRATAGEYGNLYDEYSLIAGEEPQGHMRFYGVPLSAFFYTPLAWFSPETACRLLKLQCFAALAISLWVMYTDVRRFVTPAESGRLKFAACFAVLAVAYQPFWTIYRVGGQTTPTVVLLLLAAMHCYLKRQTAATAFLLIMVILIKPAFLLPTALIAIASGFSLCAALTLGGLIAGGASILLVGFPPHVEFLDLMLTSTKTSVTWAFSSASTVAIENLRLPDHPETIYFPRPANLSRLVNLARVIIGSWFLFVAWRIQRAHVTQHVETRRRLIFLTALTFGVALMPIVWEHYLSVLFIPLIHVVAVRHRLPKTAQVITWTAIALASAQNLIIIEALQKLWNVNSWGEGILIGLLKGGPCLLTVLLLGSYNGRIARAFEERSGDGANAHADTA